MLLRLIQYKSYDSYSRSELQGQLGRPFAVHYLHYNTDSFFCQVNTVLICFVYFMQCFITIFTQYIKEETPYKMQFRRLKLLSYKAFRGHFSCVLLHTKHNLTQLYHIIHSTICQVKIV